MKRHFGGQTPGIFAIVPGFAFLTVDQRLSRLHDFDFVRPGRFGMLLAEDVGIRFADSRRRRWATRTSLPSPH